MRVLRALLILASLAALAGCEADRRAQELARQLSGVLSKYQQEVEDKIQAEQAAYKKLAEVYARAEHEQTAESLALERRERAEALAEALIAEAAANPPRPAPSLARLHAALRDYAAMDFDRVEKLLAEQGEARARFLASLEDLRGESQRLGVAARLLENLAQRRNPAEELKALAVFAGQVAEAVAASGPKGGEK